MRTTVCVSVLKGETMRNSEQKYQTTVSSQYMSARIEMKLSYAINRKWWEDRESSTKNGLE